MGLFKKTCPFYEPTLLIKGRCLNGDSNTLTDEQCLEYCFGKFKTCPQYSKSTACPYSKHEGDSGYWCDANAGPFQGGRTQVSATLYNTLCSKKYKGCAQYKR